MLRSGLEKYGGGGLFSNPHRRGASTSMNTYYNHSQTTQYANGEQDVVLQLILNSTQNGSQYSTKFNQGGGANNLLLSERYTRPGGFGNIDQSPRLGFGGTKASNTTPNIQTGMNAYQGPLAKQTFLLPNIVKQSQSPMMKPFVTKRTKAIKGLQQKSPSSNHYNRAILGAEYRRLHNDDFLDVTNTTFRPSHHMASLYDPTLPPGGDIQHYNYILQSKSVKPQFQFNNNNNNHNVDMTPISHKNNHYIAEQNNNNSNSVTIEESINAGGETIRTAMYMANTATTNVNTTHTKVALKQNQAVIIKDFDTNVAPPITSLTGTKCLIPVSENEDLQIKAAMVTLRKLKLDIEMKQVGPTIGNSSIIGGAYSKRDSASIMPTAVEQQTTLEPQQSKQMFVHSVTEKVQILPEIISTLPTHPSTDVLEPATRLVGKFKELKLPESDPQFKYSSTHNQKAMPARENPAVILQTQKMQDQLMNFSKYKQLKRYNDSLMKIQQELVHKYKEQTKKKSAQQSPTQYHASFVSEFKPPQAAAVEITRNRVEQGVDVQNAPSLESASLELEPLSSSHLQVENNSSKNPYQKSIPQKLQSVDENQEQEVTTQNFNKAPQQQNYKKEFSYTSDFQYNHHKFIPKKSFYSTRKEFNDYKRALFIDQDNLNDTALTVNQAQIGQRYHFIERTYEINDVSQQAMLSPKEENLIILENKNLVQNQEDTTGAHNDVKVVINQIELMEHERHRYLANRDKIDTLANLGLNSSQYHNTQLLNSSIRKSSSMTASQSSSKLVTKNHHQAHTPNVLITAGEVRVKHSHDGAGILSASSNRVIIVHKQQSQKDNNSPVHLSKVKNPTPDEESRVNSSTLGVEPTRKSQKRIQKDNHEKPQPELKTQAPVHRKSKSTLMEKRKRLNISQLEQQKLYQRSLFKKQLLEDPFSQHREDSYINSRLENNNLNYHYRGQYRAGPPPPSVLVSDKHCRLEEEPGWVVPWKPKEDKQSDPLPEQDRPKEVLNVKKDILKELEQLRRHKELMARYYAQQAENERSLDDARFFKTEVAMPGKIMIPETLSPMTMINNNEEYTPDLKLPRPTINEAEEINSLNFPMRNSRLSQAVMDSLTLDPSKSNNISQKLTSESLVKQHQQQQLDNKSGHIISVQGISPAKLTPHHGQDKSPQQKTPKHNIPPLKLNTTTQQPFNNNIFNEDNINNQQSPMFQLSEQGGNSARTFIKQYFKKDLQIFKEAELKIRMQLVRKAIAQLEREHFNAAKFTYKPGYHTSR